MAELVLHPQTDMQVRRYRANPAHALLLIGPAGSGKLSLARQLAADVLKIDGEALAGYPYFRVIAPEDGRAISIETIRELQHFTTLKIPGSKDISRVVVIESSHLLTTEAQNALLKTLEEPPLDTVFILTATNADTLLPTIRSRTRILQVVAPEIETLKAHLAQSFKAADIDRALLLSGGLPGLTYALLTEPESHPLYEATVQARALLGSSTYERLLLVDMLSKQKQLCQDISFILGQMARMALARNPGAAAGRWQNVLKAAFRAESSLRKNTQAKLVLMRLMLEM